MAFWSDAALEPKRAYRWQLQWGPEASWIVKKVSQPSFEISEHEHKYLNHSFWYPGRVQWKEVTFELVDPLTPDATNKMMQKLTAAGYVLPTTADITNTVSKAAATTALGQMTLTLLGVGAATGGSALGVANVGTPVGHWLLNNPWIRSVDFSELDYESDELVGITVTVRYDWAEYTATGDGAPIS